ncbi:MAG: SAM-dependent methyltransferase [Planctomycetes bacterium]|nr:SAM-dependent methyltransferase [Planctomycetota bacterium]
MDFAIARKLVSEEVESLLELLAMEQEDALALQTKLRNFLPTKLATAAGELAELRRRACAKFALAPKMYFTRDALEVASSDATAAYHAERMKGLASVFDPCCGIGSDAIAIARHTEVLAADADPARVLFAKANAAVHGVRFAHFWSAEVERIAPPAEGLFLDPARREGRRRTRDPEEWSPSPTTFVDLVQRYINVAIKAAPGIEPEEIAPAGVPYEAEFLSHKRECKELVLWFGSLRRGTRRATILKDSGPITIEGDPAQLPPLVEREPEVGSFILEPDAALIRSGLLALLAAPAGLSLLDPEIAFVHGPLPKSTPFLRPFEILGISPMDTRKVRALLKKHDIGRLVVKKRGHPSDADTLRRALQSDCPGEGTLIVTRQGESHLALLVSEVMAKA